MVSIAVAGLLLPGCGGTAPGDVLVEKSLAEAGANRRELEGVLGRYEDGRREAAAYTVAAMAGRRYKTGPGLDSLEALYAGLENYRGGDLDPALVEQGRKWTSMQQQVNVDAERLDGAFLSAHIDAAWEMLKVRRWNAGLPEEVFREMILPYRIGDEEPVLWRGLYRNELKGLEDSLARCGNSVEAARVIARTIGSVPYNDQFSSPHRRADLLLMHPVGYCREDCDRTVYAMRALGVPVAVDRMLVSPENGGPHSWNVVWDNVSGFTRMFDNGKFLPTRDSIHNDGRRKGKVYRTSFMPRFERLEKYRGTVNPPAVLLNPYLEDVTAQYFGHNVAEVEIYGSCLEKAREGVYLGIFTNGRFKPVDVGRTEGGKVVFSDIEPDLIYVPVTGDTRPCGWPFLLERTGEVRTFVPSGSKKERVSLTRKYPVRFNTRERLEGVAGVKVQSGPSAQGPWTDLFVLEKPGKTVYAPFRVGGLGKKPYLRLYNQTGHTAFIDFIRVSSDSMGAHAIPVVATGKKEKYRRLERESMSLGLDDGEQDCVVRIEEPSEARYVFVIPANDDNYVVPDQEYELMYFAGQEGWKPLGRKVSDGYELEFTAPENAVLWLRNLTKGREEQLFVWRGVRQLFNQDL